MASFGAIVCALLVAYRIIQQPGANSVTTVKVAPFLALLALAAIGLGSASAFQREAVPIHQAIDSLQDTSLHSQMTVPIALRYLLPTGMKGLFCSIMIMGLFAGDTGHLHSWGSIFIQDVVLPLRKQPMSPRQHIWALRISVAAV